MYTYHFNEWLVFFYFYCIFGWCFESAYVSLKSRKFVNRGFMRGPWLPLYGSGAIIILFATLPFSKWPWAVYFVGLVAATALEYVTGVVMVKLFKVRYWDYSNQKLQFQGHICLTSSLAWGGLSLLMVYVVHQPVAELIGKVPQDVLNVLTFLLTVLIVYDFANAFRHAMDLRAIIAESQKLLKELEERGQKYVEDIGEKFAEYKEELDEFVSDKREGFLDKISEQKDKWEEEMEALRARMELNAKQLLMNNPGSKFIGLKGEHEIILDRLMKRKEIKNGTGKRK